MQHTVTVNSLLPGPLGLLGVQGPSWTVPTLEDQLSGPQGKEQTCCSCAWCLSLCQSV